MQVTVIGTGEGVVVDVCGALLSPLPPPTQLSHAANRHKSQWRKRMAYEAETPHAPPR
jgi:hypothetical protein